MDLFLQDVRYAARKLVRSPGFTFVAVTTLALAIGATTAVFSIVNGVLLKPLPFANPEGLVRVASLGRDGKPASMSYLDFMDYRAQSRLVPAMSAMSQSTKNFTAAGSQPMRLNAYRVNANFFDVVGVHPRVGRAFSGGDDKSGAAPVVLVAEGLWKSRFGGDSSIIGRTILLDAKPYTVIGVAPAAINYPKGADVWMPFVPTGDDTDPANRGAHYMRGIGRLASGATADRARADLGQIAAQLARQYPESNAEFGATAIPLRDAIVGNVRTALLVMLGCVGFVLLIACANVANLLLVRASSRESEIAVRAALGAGRMQLMRQLVTESVLLSVSGAAIGTALAAWVLGAVRRFGPAGVPRLDEVSIDGSVLAFTALVAVMTGVLFGLVPAIHALKTNLGQMLRESTRGSSGRRGTQRTRSSLIVTEMALAVILLIGAGLLTRSFVHLMQVNPGYQPEHVVTMSLSLPDKKYPWDNEQIAFGNAIVEQMKALPGAQNAAVGFGRPLSDDGMRVTFNRNDRPRSQPGKRTVADVRVVSPGFFATLGMKMVQGRELLETDRADAPPVLVVSQQFVRKFFPDESPVGKKITLGWGRQRSANKADTVSAGGEIVGVVADIKARGAASDAPETVYLPFAQAPISDMSVLVRSTAPPAVLISAARARIKEVDPDLPIFDVKTMSDAVSESVAQPRFYTILLGSFAAIALLLAALGIYGVISYTVSQRTRELGIRIALGSSQRGVMRLVVGQGMALTGAGVALGLAGSYWLTRLIASLLFGVGAADAPTFGAVAVILLAVAGLASYIPARRAARVDPLIAMRAE
ncbi:MAG TPA: ABC transporter permease [Gemmatimonadaceae bacterium]|nr:ABC transporter permease [Gemmatimonadaceae bacterium]